MAASLQLFEYDKDVSLAIKDLEEYTKPEILGYIKQVAGIAEISGENATEIASSTNSFAPSPELRFEIASTLTRSPVNSIETGMTSPDVESINSYTITRDLGRLSLLDKELDLMSPTVLCSQLPMCRKIMLKSDILQADSAASKSKARKEPRPKLNRPEADLEQEGKKPVDKIEKAYGTLVGRINTKKSAEFHRGRKLHEDPNAGGVREFEASVSNPLYKKYKPEGYVKTEDEVVIEYIRKITSDFNEWLSKFDGELKQVDPEKMVRLLRWDLELPFNLTSSSRQS